MIKINEIVKRPTQWKRMGEISHWGGGGRVWKNFWSFSQFFLLVLIHANLQRKVYFFVLGGRGYDNLIG